MSSGIARYLVKHGGDMNSIKDSFLDLHIAIVLQQVNKVKKLISQGADPRERDNNDTQAIHWAAKSGSKEIVEYLIQECNVDVNVENRSGFRALHWAAINDHYEVVQWLVVVGGADITRGAKYMGTAVCCAKGRSLRWLLSLSGCGIEISVVVVV